MGDHYVRIYLFILLVHQTCALLAPAVITHWCSFSQRSSVGGGRRPFLWMTTRPDRAIVVVSTSQYQDFSHTTCDDSNTTIYATNSVTLDVEDDDDDVMRELYRTVARQDPEWFRKFVMEMLGEDDEMIDTEILSLVQQTRPINERKQGSDLMEVDCSHETVIVQDMSDSQSEINVDDGTLLIDETLHPFVDLTKNSTKKGAETFNDIERVDTKSKKEDIYAEEKIIRPDSVGDALAVKPREAILDDNYERISQAINVESNNTNPVFNTNIKSEENAKLPTRVFAKNSDENKVDAATMSMGRFDSAKPRPSTSPVSFVDANEPTIIMSKVSDALDSAVQTSTTTSIHVPSKRNDWTTKSNTTNEATKVVNNTTISKSYTSNTTSSISSNENRIVLFRNSFDSSWKRVNLTSLFSLSFTESEIVGLEPDALDLIVQERIRKPRSGVPKQWMEKRRMEKGDEKSQYIKIISKYQLENELSKITDQLDDKRSKVQNAFRDADVPNSRARQQKEILSDTMKPFDRKNNLVNEKDRQRRANQLDIDNAARPGPNEMKVPRATTTEISRSSDFRPFEPKRSRERRFDENGQRAVYSGRSQASNKPKRSIEVDDPPIQSGLWPNMKTFRGLLRNEAALRLRILGDDWTDAVKEEAEWRMDLYKNWLWTVHNGVGEPFVQSRSDRVRRRRQAIPTDRRPSSRPTKRRP